MRGSRATGCGARRRLPTRSRTRAWHASAPRDSRRRLMLGHAKRAWGRGCIRIDSPPALTSISVAGDRAPRAVRRRRHHRREPMHCARKLHHLVRARRGHGGARVCVLRAHELLPEPPALRQEPVRQPAAGNRVHRRVGRARLRPAAHVARHGQGARPVRSRGQLVFQRCADGGGGAPPPPIVHARAHAFVPSRPTPRAHPPQTRSRLRPRWAARRA